MTDTTTCTEDINPAILSSDDLINLRSSNNGLTPESISEKFYVPTESDKSLVTSLLKDQKKMLDQKLVARMADLIQAEWKPDLKKAVTTKLKGKTQHMGKSIDGKMCLSLEETLFLLENGSMELYLNGIPLSTESAYANVLSDDLALEKYQVYSHLSRLGFIVVQHQKDVNLARNEKLHAMNKCQCSKKRKLREANSSNKKICPPNGISAEQRTISPCQLPSDRVSPQHSSGENSHLEQIDKKLGETPELETGKRETARNGTVSSALKNNVTNEEQFTSISLTTADSSVKDTESRDVDIVGSIDDGNCDSTGASLPQNLNVSDIPKSMPCPDDNAVEISEAASTDVCKDTTDTAKSPKDSTDGSGVTDEVNVVHSDRTTQDYKETESSIVCEKNAGDSEDTPISVDEDSSLECSENGINQSIRSEKRNLNIDIQSSNSLNSNKVTDSDSKPCPKSGTVVSNEPDCDQIIIVDSLTTNSTKPRINVFRIDDNDMSSDSDTSGCDVLYVDESCHELDSSQSCAETNDDSVQSVSEVVEADDVMIVEISKRQSEPLEVIDLSSDDSSESEKDATDDDEVLIIEECSKSNSAPRVKGWFSSGPGPKLKKEGGKKAIFKMERNDQNSITFSFPNLFRKRVVCLPCPPVHLLPFNVSMSKEAYTIDLTMLTGPNNYRPVQRVWNSYKDLQQRMYNFKNDAGLPCDYPRGYASNSSQPNSNFNPFSSGPSQSPHTAPFPSNLLPQHNRFDLPSEERGFSPHMAQPTAFSSTPMAGAVPPNRQFPLGPNQPSVNSGSNPFPTGNPHMHNSRQREHFSAIEDSSQNTGCNVPNPWNSMERSEDGHMSFKSLWQSSKHCEEGASFRSSPNPWQNEETGRSSQNIWSNTPPHSWQNEETGRSSQNIWSNTPPLNTSYGSSPNIRGNMPCNEESLRVCPSPWMNPPQGEGYRSSPNSFGPLRGPPNFQNNNAPFQDPYGNFANPWASNWRAPPMLQARHDFQQNPMNMPNRNFMDNPFPCDIPKVSARASSWRDFKSSTHPDKDAEENNDDDSEVQEVAIDFDEVLWSREIRPLVRPGNNLSFNEVLKTLQITTSANVSTSTSFNGRLLPDSCTLQVSFDVYMPGTVYKKTCPTVPSHRIIVTRAADSFPKLSDIIILQRKFQDAAILQFAVVDNGSIAFYSFNNVDLPVLLPHQ